MTLRGDRARRKSDSILAERYQYDRKLAQRMGSCSMAKTTAAMLVGVALSKGGDMLGLGNVEGGFSVSWP